MKISKSHQSNQNPSISKQPQQLNDKGNFKAYLLMALSNICLVFMQLCFKKMTVHVSPLLLLNLRAGILFLFNLYPINQAGLSFNIKQPTIAVFHMVLKRSFVSFLTVAFFISSIKYIPIGIANALQSTSPIIVFFIQIFYYKKGKIYWINFIIILTSFAGVILIVQPQFIFGSEKNGSQEGFGLYYGMVLCGAVCSALSMIFLHDLRNTVHELIALQYAYLFQSSFNVMFFILIMGNQNSQSQNLDVNSETKLVYLPTNQLLFLFLMLILMSVFAYFAQYLRAKSIYLCTPALVMPFNYLNVVLGFLVDVLIFGSKYDWKVILGMVMASAGLLSKFLVLKIQESRQKFR